jgi:hypothetical protein
VLGHPEEGRYASLRNKRGASAERRLFFFYQSQALFGVFFALSALVEAVIAIPMQIVESLIQALQAQRDKQIGGGKPSTAQQQSDSNVIAQLQLDRVGIQIVLIL